MKDSYEYDFSDYREFSLIGGLQVEVRIPRSLLEQLQPEQELLGAS